MALLDKMKDSISVAGQEVSQRARTATESSRINGQIKANERMIEKLTYQVGVQCVDAHILEPDSEYRELFAEILRLREENKEYQDEFNRLTAVSNCPQCGYGNNISAKFCINCGAPLSAVTTEGKKCVSCGYVNDKDAIFCVECGMALPKEDTV